MSNSLFTTGQIPPSRNQQISVISGGWVDMVMNRYEQYPLFIQLDGFALKSVSNMGALDLQART